MFKRIIWGTALVSILLAAVSVWNAYTLLSQPTLQTGAFNSQNNPILSSTNFKVFNSKFVSFKYPYSWLYTIIADTPNQYLAAFTDRGGLPVMQLEVPALDRSLKNWISIRNNSYFANDARTTVTSDLYRPCVENDDSEKPCSPQSYGGFILAKWQKDEPNSEIVTPNQTASLIIQLAAAHSSKEEGGVVAAGDEILKSFAFKIAASTDAVLTTTTDTLKWKLFNPKGGDFMVQYPPLFKPQINTTVVGFNQLSTVAFDVPAIYYKSTNLKSGTIAFGKKQISTPKDCFFNGDTTPEKYVIANTSFYKLTHTEGAAGSQYETNSYVTIKNGQCYYAAVLLVSENVDNFDPAQRPKKFNRQSLLNLFDQIASTFKFTK